MDIHTYAKHTFILYIHMVYILHIHYKYVYVCIYTCTHTNTFTKAHTHIYIYKWALALIQAPEEAEGAAQRPPCPAALPVGAAAQAATAHQPPT